MKDGEEEVAMWSVLRILAVLTGLLALSGCAPRVAQAPGGDDPGNRPLRAQEILIKVDRTVGLIPLEVQIAGTLLDSEHNETRLDEDQKVHLEIATTHYRILGGGGSNTSFHTAGIDELDAAGLANPMVRNLKIHRAGTYHFRLILEDEEGNQVHSNQVTVKAM